MSNEPNATEAEQAPASVELPMPTVAPMVLSLGLILLAAGTVMGLFFLVTGGAILAVGLALWIAALLPGRGHMHEPMVDPALRSAPAAARPGKVEQMRPGMAGYRLRLPEEVYSISAGIKGGIVGGLLMPVPALLYGLLSRHGVWYPVNLLAGMVLPGIDPEQLDQFNLTMLLVALIIHCVMSVVMGLIYGVLLPTLPAISGHVTWGGLLMPLVWTGITYGSMSMVDPALEEGVSWPWFIITQFVFGVIAAEVATRLRGSFRPVLAGIVGGLAGGLVMPLPAMLWGVTSDRGIWYPLNLLAGVVMPSIAHLPVKEWSSFHLSWFLAGLTIHVLMCTGFGALYGLGLRRLPAIPGALAWGGMLFPLLWTGMSYGLMGVANPVLQTHVEWPWFILSQFVFGATAAFVVDRSVMIPVPPAGVGE